MAYQDLNHLQDEYIDPIALGLDGDVYGARGELSDEEILQRVMENIRETLNYPHRDDASVGVVSLELAARLIISVWGHKDRAMMKAIAEAADAYRPLPAELPR
jgi:hypothetical protein